MQCDLHFPTGVWEFQVWLLLLSLSGWELVADWPGEAARKEGALELGAG